MPRPPSPPCVRDNAWSLVMIIGYSPLPRAPQALPSHPTLPSLSVHRASASPRSPRQAPIRRSSSSPGASAGTGTRLRGGGGGRSSSGSGSRGTGARGRGSPAHEVGEAKVLPSGVAAAALGGALDAEGGVLVGHDVVLVLRVHGPVLRRDVHLVVRQPVPAEVLE